MVTILWRDIHVRSIYFHFRWKAKVIFELLFSRSTVSNSFWPHGLQHASLSCPSPSPRVCSNSCPLSQWWHPTISSYSTPFSSCLQPFPASGSFPISWLFTQGGQSIGALASVLPMNIQDWFTLGLAGLISLQSREHSRVFSNTTVQKHQFFSAQPSYKEESCPTLTSIHDYWKTIALTIWTFVSKVMSLLFNMLCRFVTAFLPRNKSFNFMAAVTICSDFGAPLK